MLKPRRAVDRDPDPAEFRGARKTTNVMLEESPGVNFTADSVVKRS